MVLANEAMREAYQERAAIVEYDAKIPRAEAERLALEMTMEAVKS
jgi:hypothetical protein